MESKKITNSDRIKGSFSYIPLAGIFLYFTENDKSDFLIKHIRYGISLFIGFIIIRIILVTILNLPFNSILSLTYIIVSGIFAFKVYKGEDVNIEYIDKFEDKIKNEMNDTESKNHFDEEIDDNKIKTNNSIVNSIVGSFNSLNDKKTNLADDSKENSKDNKKNEDILNF